MTKLLALVLLATVTLTAVSCGGEDSENSEETNLAKNYVILNVKGGDAIKVEAENASWSDDHISGITEIHYSKEGFTLQFTDLSERIKAGVKSLHGQKFPSIITYEGKDYSTTCIVKDSEEGETNDYLGTEYVLSGSIVGFEMGGKKVSDGKFAFKTYKKK